MDNNTKEHNTRIEKKDPLNPYLKHARQSIEEQSSFIRTLNIVLLSSIIIISSIFLLADNKAFLEEHFGKDSFITNAFVKLTASNEKKEKAEFSFPFGLRRQNVLFLGVDAGENERDSFAGTRSDTIIILNIDPRTKSVNAISVPRDSKIYLPKNAGVNKINAAHAIGGVKMAKQTIENTLGIRIDRYVVVNDNAVKEIVDTLGGVDIYVEKNMRYNDYSGKLHINLKKGNNHLDGQEAVGYLRFRHDAMGDIGRTQRQQWLLRALAKQMKDPKVITKVPDIISVAKKNIKTDMSLYEMSQYAAVLRSLDMDRVEIATLPGSPNKKGYISYWILDPEKTQEVINRLIYRDRVVMDEKHPMAATVMFSEDNEVAAGKLIGYFEEAGIEVKCKGTANRTHSQFISHSNKVNQDYYNWLKKKAPGFSGYQFVYDPVNQYCANTDFTVILAGN